MNNSKLVIILLRLSIASVFLYAAVAATLEPSNWIGYVPPFAYKIAPANTLLVGFAIYQVILVLWILTGWKSLYSSLLAAITLLGIISANWGDIDVLFRDFAIFFAALALAASSYTRNIKSK